MTVGLLLVGLAAVLGAVALCSYALLANPVPRIARSRRVAVSHSEGPWWRPIYRGFVGGVDVLLKGRAWVPIRAAELEMADVHKPVGVIVSWVVVGSSAAFGVGALALRSMATGLLLAVLVPLALKLVLRVRAGRRRKAFAGQLDQTLRIVASALRAGQSLPIAMASVGLDAEAPMSEEITRISNEARVGRDLVEAMLESAERMKSEDFRWFAEAVDVQRDTGGNLNDIIDTVAETIRDRAEIREKIRANASEGKASAWVLMALPVALAVVYTFMNPGYLDPLFSSAFGVLLLVVSVVLYGVSYVWMRAIVNFKV